MEQGHGSDIGLDSPSERRWYLGTHSPPSQLEGMNSPSATSRLGWPWYLRTHSPPSHLREGMNSVNATAILGNKLCT